MKLNLHQDKITKVKGLRSSKVSFYFQQYCITKIWGWILGSANEEYDRTIFPLWASEFAYKASPNFAKTTMKYFFLIWEEIATSIKNI